MVDATPAPTTASTSTSDRESSAAVPSTTIDNEQQYLLDSGLTAPSKEIRDRWSHKRPICVHDDTDMDKLCPKCSNVPRALVNKISQELYNRIHGNACESWELITMEEWKEVTDDESDSDDALNAKMDRNLENSTTINTQWDELDDDNDTIVKAKTQDEDDDQDVDMTAGVQGIKRPSTNERHTNDDANANANAAQTGSLSLSQPQSQSRQTKLTSSQSVVNLHRNTSLQKRPSSAMHIDSSGSSSHTNKLQKASTLSTVNLHHPPHRSSTGTRMAPPPSSSSQQRPMSMSRTPAQPPLPAWSTERRSTQAGNTPSLKITPRRTTPLFSQPRNANKSASNVMMLGKEESDKEKKNIKEKKMLEHKLREKENELKEQEEKIKTLKNRKMKKKAQDARQQIEKEIDEIQTKLKTL